MSAGTGQCLRAKGEENPAEEVEGEQSVRQEENQELLTQVEEAGVSDPSKRLSGMRVKEASLALALGGHWPTVLGVHWDRSLFVMGSAEQRKSRGDSPDNSFKEFN